MEKLFKQRSEFNEAFSINSRAHLGNLSEASFGLEYRMLAEELEEYLTACMENDTIEIVDAIGDMLYLIIGVAKKHGMTPNMLESVMNEIHQSNMSKLHNGKVVKDENGKVSKPDTFNPPNLVNVLKSHI